MATDQPAVPPVPPELIVVADVVDFRRFARDRIGPHDSVLEIGCSSGATTRVLAKRGAVVLAVDCSRELVARATTELAEYPRVQVRWVDGRDLPRLAELMPHPDALFLDVGGDALLGNVASVLRECLLTFRPRLFVVRSQELGDLLGMVTEFHPPDRPRLRWARPPAADRRLDCYLAMSRSLTASDRQASVRGLRKLTSPAALERLRELAQDANGGVRRAAQRALARLEPPSATTPDTPA